MRVGPAFQFKGYNGEISTTKTSSDKRIKESSGSFYSFRADVNFQIAVALACLHRDDFDMHQYSHKQSQLLGHKVVVG